MDITFVVYLGIAVCTFVAVIARYLGITAAATKAPVTSENRVCLYEFTIHNRYSIKIETGSKYNEDSFRFKVRDCISGREFSSSIIEIPNKPYNTIDEFKSYIKFNTIHSFRIHDTKCGEWIDVFLPYHSYTLDRRVEHHVVMIPSGME
jgi:hypothetical protein